LEQFLSGLRTAWKEGEVRPTSIPKAKPKRLRRRLKEWRREVAHLMVFGTMTANPGVAPGDGEGRDECMREHFVRAIANEDLFGLDPVMDGERLAQLLRLRIGIKRRVSTAAARIASSASGEGPNGLSLVLSFTRLAMRGCSPGT
jgi:hypothetical protein